MNRNTVLQTLMEILKKQFHGRQILILELKASLIYKNFGNLYRKHLKADTRGRTVAHSQLKFVHQK